METFVAYLLGVNVLLLLQAAYYRLFLARGQRFLWNRIFLMGGMAAALALPLLRWDAVQPVLPAPARISVLPEIVIHPGLPMSAAAPVATGWTAWDVVLLVYGVGAATALAVLLVRYMYLARLIMRGRKEPQAGYTLVTTREGIGPASFFRYIFWNAGQPLDAEGAAVALAHERCHVRQWHSLDLLAVELLKALCWFNPAIYVLRKDLRRTHEYLADQAALAVAGVDGIKRLMLLRHLGARQLAITHCFHSQIQARMKMLMHNPRRRNGIAYLLALPLAALVAACTSIGHPLDAPTSFAIVDSPATPAAKQAAAAEPVSMPYSPIFDLDNMLTEATLPLAGSGPQDKGMVCLGEMPQVLNLDSVATDGGDQPRLLNRDHVMRLVGYPEEAERKKITGKVLVKVLVDETGRVIRHQFVGESDPVLRKAVEEHASELLFQPGKKAGKPDKWWVIVPFNFGPGGC